MPAIPNPYLHRLPVPARTADVQTLRQHIDKLHAALALVVGVLALLLLGSTLYPTGQPTRPLRVAEETPVSRTAWYWSDSLNE